jgi:hypothetical protein
VTVWRWLAVVAFGVAVLETVCALDAYWGGTMTFDHSEALFGWPAVRLVCLVFVPLILLGLAVLGAVFIVLVGWAMGEIGGRR